MQAMFPEKYLSRSARLKPLTQSFYLQRQMRHIGAQALWEHNFYHGLQIQIDRPRLQHGDLCAHKGALHLPSRYTAN